MPTVLNKPLVGYVVRNLPVLFTQDELENSVLPALAPDQVALALQDMQYGLLQLSGIGQAAYMAQDPLGLKDLVLSRLIHMAPSQSARIYQGQLISSDGRHLLMTATLVICIVVALTAVAIGTARAETFNTLTQGGEGFVPFVVLIGLTMAGMAAIIATTMRTPPSANRS